MTVTTPFKRRKITDMMLNTVHILTRKPVIPTVRRDRLGDQSWQLSDVSCELWTASEALSKRRPRGWATQKRWTSVARRPLKRGLSLEIFTCKRWTMTLNMLINHLSTVWRWSYWRWRKIHWDHWASSEVQSDVLSFWSSLSVWGFHEVCASEHQGCL